MNKLALKLAENLKQAAAVKTEMTVLLHDLEQTVAKHPIEKPGAWRHHPAEWAARHLDVAEEEPKTT